MANPIDDTQTCTTCGDSVPAGSFDLTVMDPDGERHFFGVPAAACPRCATLVLDVDAERLYRIDRDWITGAIGSDRLLLGHDLIVDADADADADGDVDLEADLDVDAA